jgi:phosphopantothenoylcysteine decarboxylase / phosphopantothenate---cysteine ligase
MADRLLAGKRVLLGVTGGIAAYKAADLCSKLVQAGAEVDVILTEAAARFVAPLTFSAISNRPARIDMWTEPAGEAIPHVRMAAAADLAIVAPLSANTLAKLALGLADNLLTSTLLATVAPLALAPAMESHMWLHPATQANLAMLVSRGALIIGPEQGRLASGAMGVGRMAEPAEILAAARLLLARGGPLAGRHVMITAGGTQEALDPVRFLTNASSGKMGAALARAALDMGAAVTLVHAPMPAAVPFGVTSMPVRSALEMQAAVMDRLASTDIFIGAAAVADYRPAEAAGQKIKKDVGDLTLRLVRNPDILAGVSMNREGIRPRAVIGFAAETQDLLANAAVKLARKNLDIIVANDVTEPGSGFGSDDNRVTLLYKDGGQEALPLMDKAEVAARVLAAAAAIL